MGGRSLNQSASDLKDRINQANQGLEKVSIREKTTGCMCGGDTSPPSQEIAPKVATK